MKMLKLLPLWAMLLALVFVTGCSSDDEEAALTTSQQLTANPWNLTSGSFEFSIPGIELPDSVNGFDPIQELVASNATLELRTDQTFTLTATDAETGEVTNTEGTWELLNDEQQIRLTNFLGDMQVDEDGPISGDVISEFEVYSIDGITKNTLDLSNSTTIEVEIPGVPIPVPVTVEVIMNMQR
jgi:hypothetical protein